MFAFCCFAFLVVGCSGGSTLGSLRVSITAGLYAAGIGYRHTRPSILHPTELSRTLPALPHTGAWLIHPVIILMGKVLIDSIPNMTASYSWTMINLGYVLVSAPRNLGCRAFGVRRRGIGGR